MNSLRYRLFTHFMLIILLQVVFAAGFAWFYFQENFQHILDENFTMLSSIKKNIESTYQQQIEEFERLSKSEVFVSYNRSQAQSQIESYLKLRGITSTVHFYRPNGDLEFFAKSGNFISYLPEKNVRLHADKKFVDSFNQATKHQKLTYTPPLYTRNNYFYNVVLLPVFDQQKVLSGVLSIAFFPNEEKANASFDGLALLDENFLAMADSNGNILAANNIKADAITKTIKSYISRRGPTPDDPFTYVRKEIPELKYEVGEETFYLLSRRIGELPIFVVLGVNEKVFLYQKKRLLNFIISLTALSALVGMIATILISRKVSRGLEEVREAVKNLKKGLITKRPKGSLPKDFNETLAEIDDLSVEIYKGKLLGNLWGQESLSRDAEKDL